MNEREQQRQQIRTRGQYARMKACPRCGERRALEPAYSVRDGGRVPDGNEWAGDFLCAQCINRIGVKP